jgi:SNF2 family DNA or RNA helicase
MVELKTNQAEAFKIAKDRNLALIHDCGTGKTLTSLLAARYHRSIGNWPALVITLPNLIESAWKEDADEFTPDLDVVSLCNKNPDRRYDILKQDHDIFCVSPETFKNMYSKIADRGFKTMFIDESSKLKDHTSQYTRAVLALSGFKSRAKGGVGFKVAGMPIQHRYALSGTPAPNSPIEYWSQVKLITGPGNQIFSDNFYSFRARFFYSVPIGLTGQNMWIFRKDTFEEFCYLLAQAVHVARLEDVLDLPGYDIVHREVELSQKERVAYNEMKHQCVLDFGTEKILSATAITKVMKLRQLSSGFCYGNEDTYRVGSSKLNELRSIIEEDREDPLLIWVNFKEESRLLSQEIKDCVVLEGNNRDEIIKNFKAGKIRHLVANPQSAGHGLTFVNCCRDASYSQNYSYELAIQARRRIYRMGQIRRCKHNILIAKNTIDGPIRAAQLKKERMVNAFLECLVKIQNGQTPDFNSAREIFSKSDRQIISETTMPHLRDSREEGNFTNTESSLCVAGVFE